MASPDLSSYSPRSTSALSKQAVPHCLLVLFLFIVLAAAPFVAPPTASAAKPGGSTSWKYTALGDSLATGIFAFEGYVPRYKDYIQAGTGASVSLTNLGKNGWTSGDLLNALRTDNTFRRAVRSSQVVTFNAGGNDWLNARDSYRAGECGGVDNQDCLKSTVETFKANWDAIIAEILALRGITDPTDNTTTIIRTMDIYNPYVDEDKAADSWDADNGQNDFDVFQPYIDTANAYIASTSTSNNIPYAQVYAEFNLDANGSIVDPSTKGYLAFDGLHSNDTGHKAIADRLGCLGYAPLNGTSTYPC